MIRNAGCVKRKLRIATRNTFRDRSMSTPTKYFEDFHLGEKFHIPAKTMTDAHFLFFAWMTGDNHPIHYDDEYAKTTRFGKRVAHGLLVASMTASGASTLSPMLEGSIVAFVEQSSRFLKPVLIGDTITPELEVTQLVPKPTGVTWFDDTCEESTRGDRP